MAYFTTRRPLVPAQVWVVIALDFTWVVASVLLLLTRALPLTTGGSWAVLIVGDIVLLFALAQTFLVRRLSR